MMKMFSHNRKARKAVTVIVIAMGLLFSQIAVSAKTLNEAVKTATKGGNSKVISARTVNKNLKRTHEVRVLTNKGKVKTIRYPANRKILSPKNQKKHRPNDIRR